MTKAIRDGGDAPVLCVDLDGTLVATDLLWETLIAMARTRPGDLLRVPSWLLRGRAHLKQRAARSAMPDAATLPYRPEVLALIEEKRAAGYRILLTTASDEAPARAVAASLGVFDGVVASDGRTNAKGGAKLRLLRESIGEGSFEYVGDSMADLPLLREASRGYLVAPGRSLSRAATAGGRPCETLCRRPRSRTRSLWKELRPHQWAKNALVAVPLLAGHEIFNLSKLVATCSAFVAFCLCASGVYVLNDMLDLDADRRHPTKRRRPVAAGELSIPGATLLVVATLGAGLGGATAVLPAKAAALLLLYVLLATAYSLVLKRKMMVDVLTLAGLYTLRILVGGAAADIRVSSWLLAFSMFLFLSLALAKRYTELSALPAASSEKIRGRGYGPPDLDLLRSVGPTAGYIATLLVVLYINLSPDVARHYPDASALYLIVPVILYWIMRIWFLAQRQQLDEDPVVFALRDRHSLVAGALVLALFLVASHWRPGIAG
jgi:4-hydroxybenzoate polyprenyltransferase/phosphoserine phosphatase